MPGRFLRSGAVAGALSTLAFTALHHLLISDIWFAVVPMMVAGAVCGGSIGYTYALMIDAPAVGTWLGYNLAYLVALGVLGVASVVVFEPVTTVAAVIQANEPPTDLFGTALPMTIVVLFGMSLLVGGLYGRSRKHYVAAFVTCAVVITFLGLNISVIGLVDVPRGSMYLIVELFALTFVLGAVYALGVLILERRVLGGKGAKGS